MAVGFGHAGGAGVLDADFVAVRPAVAIRGKILWFVLLWRVPELPSVGLSPPASAARITHAALSAEKLVVSVALLAVSVAFDSMRLAMVDFS